MKKRVISFIVSMLVIGSSGVLSVSASESVPIEVEVVSLNQRNIMPYADSIVVKFRVHNGVTQYRRWNETKNCWVDPHWINL